MVKARQFLLTSAAFPANRWSTVSKWRMLKIAVLCSAFIGSYFGFLYMSTVRMQSWPSHSSSFRSWIGFQLPYNFIQQQQQQQRFDQTNSSKTFYYSAQSLEIISDAPLAANDVVPVHAHHIIFDGRSSKELPSGLYLDKGVSLEGMQPLPTGGLLENLALPASAGLLPLPPPTFVADIRALSDSVRLRKDESSGLSLESLHNRALSLHRSFNDSESAAGVYDQINDNGTGICVPQRNIVFLKTHKCASSTMQNIIMRYGLEYNLTFVLPPVSNYLGHPAKFRPNFAVPLRHSRNKTDPGSAQFNILTHHTRFDYTAIASVMPSNTTYITILREPAAHFESLYEYVNLQQRYNASLRQFVRFPAKYYRSSRDRMFAWNPMMFDLGLDWRNMRDEAKIDAKIAEIDQKFAVVLMSEFLKEGLIVMSSILCWPLESVVALKRNARPESKKLMLSEIDKQRIYYWNAADKKLYDFFYAKFQLQMDAYGRERLANDVALLDAISEQTEIECGFEELEPKNITNAQYKPWKPYVRGFVPSGVGARNETCQALARAENPFTDLLRARQWPERFGPVAMARASAYAAAQRAAAAKLRRQKGNDTLVADRSNNNNTRVLDVRGKA